MANGHPAECHPKLTPESLWVCSGGKVTVTCKSNIATAPGAWRLSCAQDFDRHTLGRFHGPLHASIGDRGMFATEMDVFMY